MTDRGGKPNPAGRGADAASRRDAAVYDVAAPAVTSPRAAPLTLFDPVDVAAAANDSTSVAPVDDVPNGSGGTNDRVNGE